MAAGNRRSDRKFDSRLERDENVQAGVFGSFVEASDIRRAEKYLSEHSILHHRPAARFYFLSVRPEVEGH